MEVNVDTKSFGHRLRVIMADRGVSVGELAERSGISRQTVGSYLNNGAIPSLQNACQIARVLGVSLDELAVEPLKNVLN